MKKSLLLAAVLLLTCALNVGALTWQEAISLAQRNNPELLSAQKQLESSEWSYRKAYTPLLPQLSASASLRDTGSATAGASSQSYSYGLSVSQTIFDGLSNLYSIQSSYADVEYKRAALLSTRALVLYDVRSAFVDLFIAQENISLLAAILKQRESNSRLIELRYESGKEDKGNLMTTQADEARARQELVAAQRELKLAKLKLSQILGVTVISADEEKAKNAPAEPDLDKLMLTTPTYIMAAQQLRSYELAYQSSLSGFLPSLSLSGSWSKSGSQWPPDSESKSWTLSLSYSLFPGGSNFISRAQAAVQLDQAREDQKSTLLDLRYSLEEAYQNYLNQTESLKVSEVSLQASQERAQITQAKFLNGITLYDEWDRIQNTYIQAQKSLLNQKRSALLAEALWHKTYGGYVQ